MTTDDAARSARSGGPLQAYGSLSVLLHWTIFALICVQLGLGWWMNEVLGDHSPLRTQVMFFHVSFGLTVLLLALVRIALRLYHPAPAPAPGVTRLQAELARSVHGLLYLLMLAIPLTGWALASGRSNTVPFWGLPFPAMPGVHGLAHDQRHALSHAHVFVLIWILIVAFALHVGGALVHQFGGHPILWRMGLGRRPVGGERQSA